jgi:trk system potassium uptake protein TrkA
LHTIIIGCGRSGAELAIQLSRRGHDVVVIDKEAEAFKRLGSVFNGLTLRGYGNDEELLKEAGIDRCDALASVTNSDSVNMMTAEIAIMLYHVPHVIIRLYQPELEKTVQLLGLDYVNGTSLIAQALFEKLTSGYSHSLTVRGDTEVIEFIAGPELDNKKVLNVQIPNEFRICLITRDGSSLIPWRDTLLRERDILLAVVKSSSYSKVKRYMRNG